MFADKINGGRNNTAMKTIRYALYYLVAAIMIYYFIMSAISPVRYIRGLNNSFGPDSLVLATTGKEYFSDSLFIDISNRLSFAKARTRMASSDSIGLTVNLPDSVVIIEIKGVALKRIPVAAYRMAGSLRGVKPAVWTKLLAEPFTVESAVSTIAKHPVMIKIAPRDTAEASAMPDIVPDTTGTEPVFFTLRLNHGFRVTFLQNTGTAGKKERVALNRYLNRRRLDDFLLSALYIVSFRFPPYEPEIRLTVAKEDARAIYRAIPSNGNIVLRIR